MTIADTELEIPVEDVEEVLAEVLVEEISIDGMCGVY
jgi:mycofactocin precursor